MIEGGQAARSLADIRQIRVTSFEALSTAGKPLKPRAVRTDTAIAGHPGARLDGRRIRPCPRRNATQPSPRGGIASAHAREHARTPCKEALVKTNQAGDGDRTRTRSLDSSAEREAAIDAPPSGESISTHDNGDIESDNE